MEFPKMHFFFQKNRVEPEPGEVERLNPKCAELGVFGALIGCQTGPFGVLSQFRRVFWTQKKSG